ncbi:MAG: fused MFS/spermidine synthase [Armatimonadota bacterium]|nr:fused MFS/spermidine synthase [Armatimonadota bacterium]MCX7777030.1 fused MFS/spermidine synthase [Armatimonadota bacterium]MDW8024902.1 fused MFS/spermidine synthase [Armatimonadota bacterium]
MLYLVAFIAGGVGMALEIVGSRIMAPGFGSGVNVWSSLISVFLLGWALGSYIGGMFADRYPKAIGLMLIALFNTPAIGLINLFGRQLCLWISDRYIAGQLGPLLAAFILFLPSCILFGMVSPYAIRLLTESPDFAGRVAGRVYAVSTMGSLVGTLSAGFILIPMMPVSVILKLLALTMLLTAMLAAAHDALQRRAIKLKLPAATILLLICLLTSAPCKILYEKDSAYHHIIVEQVGSVRILRFGPTYQSAIDLADPDRAVFPYTDYFHLSFIFNQDIKRVLMVGLGGGTVPMRFWRDYQDVEIDVVEIDPDVKDVAVKFFGFKEDKRLKVFIDDGRLFLRRSNKRYDLIMMDAYTATRYGLSVPFHLATKEFFELVKERLTDNGILAYNLIGQLEGRNSRSSLSFIKTISSVFASVYIFPVEYRKRPWLYSERNIILIATKAETKLKPNDIVAKARLLAGKRVHIPLFVERAMDLYERKLDLSNLPIFTDDYAPTEWLRQ